MPIRQTLTRDRYIELANKDLAQLLDVLQKYTDDNLPPRVLGWCKEHIELYQEFLSLIAFENTTLSDLDALSERAVDFYHRTHWKGHFLPDYIDGLKRDHCQ
jgi:hypothetical protein